MRPSQWQAGSGSQHWCSWFGRYQVRISPIEIRLSRDLRQGLRTDLNDHAFGSFDLLFRIEKSRIALERSQDRLIKRKRGNLA